MSRFHASIHGGKGEKTLQGTPKSGINGHIRGWDVGIQVNGEVDSNGNDMFCVYLTSGTNGRKLPRFLGIFTIKDLEEVKP
jgi:hypothetical protein